MHHATLLASFSAGAFVSPAARRCGRYNGLMTLKVLLETGEDGWFIAHVPALRGCVSQGKSREEALANIKEAVECWLEVADFFERR